MCTHREYEYMIWMGSLYYCLELSTFHCHDTNSILLLIKHITTTAKSFSPKQVGVDITN
jgi:hypothetical protein